MTRTVAIALSTALLAGTTGRSEESAPDPAAVAEVLAGKRTTASAAWWGFDPEDATASIQSALDSGARQVVIPNTGRPWIVRPIRLSKSDQEVLFEKGVSVVAKKGEFKDGGDCLFQATNVRNLVLRGPGAILEMRKTDYWGDDYPGGQWRHGLSLRGCSNVQVLDNDSYGAHFYFYRVLKESEPVSILVEKCRVGGGHIGLHVAGGKSGSAGGRVVFRDCTVGNTIKSGITCREIPADSNLEIAFEDIRLNDVSTRKPLPAEVEAVYRQYKSRRAPWHCRCHHPQPCLDTVPNAASLTENWKGWYPYGPIVLWAKTADGSLQGGIRFSRCVVTEPKDVPVFVAAGTGGTDEGAPPELKGWTKISGDIQAISPGGVKSRIVAPLVDVSLRINGKPLMDKP